MIGRNLHPRRRWRTYGCSDIKFGRKLTSSLESGHSVEGGVHKDVEGSLRPVMWLIHSVGNKGNKTEERLVFR